MDTLRQIYLNSGLVMNDTASIIIGVIATLILSAQVGQALGDWLARRVHANKMNARAAALESAAPAPDGAEASSDKNGDSGKTKSK